MSKVLDFPAVRIAKGIHSFTPEMGQRKVNAQMDASLSHYGNHYFVDTQLELKGRGITLLKIYSEENFIRPSHKVGWKSYKVTTAAFEKLKSQYSISMECNLD